jgi:RNA recognition motif-containing protein
MACSASSRARRASTPACSVSSRLITDDRRGEALLSGPAAQQVNYRRTELVTDRDTGRARGFAFVEMTDSAEADRAIAALNGTNFNGRNLSVNEARPRAQVASRGFGGPPRQRREPRR